MNAKRSVLGSPRTFWARTAIPSRSSVVSAHSFGTPSIAIRVFDDSPSMLYSPRGRWYLRLRPKIRTPPA